MPRPSEADTTPADNLRRTGHRYQLTGAAIITTTLIATLIAAILTGDLVWVDSKGQYFFTLADCIVVLAGATLVIIGVGKVNLSVVQAEFQAYAAEMAKVTDRLATIEEVIDRVPDYGQAVLDGITIQRHAVDPDRA